mmetsp:Transcript_11367/g.39641  ORF Transcript_11367/g.39641 Transcript_11367/m.39641 type:complete len:263 (+) Transcript_11367:330-1118(+)
MVERGRSTLPPSERTRVMCSWRSAAAGSILVLMDPPTRAGSAIHCSSSPTPSPCVALPSMACHSRSGPTSLPAFVRRSVVRLSENRPSSKCRIAPSCVIAPALSALLRYTHSRTVSGTWWWKSSCSKSRARSTTMRSKASTTNTTASASAASSGHNSRCLGEPGTSTQTTVFQPPVTLLPALLSLTPAPAETGGTRTTVSTTVAMPPVSARMGATCAAPRLPSDALAPDSAAPADSEPPAAASAASRLDLPAPGRPITTTRG